jgi:hypothetical protein
MGGGDFTEYVRSVTGNTVKWEIDFISAEWDYVWQQTTNVCWINQSIATQTERK